MVKRSIEEQLFEQLMHTRRKLTGHMRPPMPMPHDPRAVKGDGMPDGKKPCGPREMPLHGFRPPMGRPPFAGEEMLRPMLTGHDRMPGFPPPPMPLHRERCLEILLSADDEGMTQKQLGEQMHIAPSSLSELVNKLENQQYVVRRADPDDKRATRILLTEMGRQRAYEVSDERREALSPLFEKLTDEEKEQLLTLLRKLNA